MDKTYYQLVRVKHRDTGKPTTLSIDHTLYIQACRQLRSVDAVNKLVGKLALECVPSKGKTFSATVSADLEKHLRELTTSAG